jgi:hypothetical protein
MDFQMSTQKQVTIHINEYGFHAPSYNVFEWVKDSMVIWHVVTLILERGFFGGILMTKFFYVPWIMNFSY